MKKSRFAGLIASTGLAALAVAVAPAVARDNPVDAVSNPSALNYGDVEARRPDFKPPFLRDGVAARSDQFGAVKPGKTQAEVKAALGAPVREAAGARGVEWEYSFKLRMPSSDNLMVCQYKVIFDTKLEVQETAWRRRQCMELAAHRS